MATPSSRDQGAAPDSPDVLEQRQLAVGGLEDVSDAVDEHGAPVSPDDLVQRLREDGTFEPGVFDRGTGAPLTADMIEQRQVVEYDDEDDRPVE